LAQAVWPRAPRRLDEGLLDLRPLRLEDVAEPRRDGKVVPQRLLLLEDVPDRDAGEQEERSAEDVEEEVRSRDGGRLGDLDFEHPRILPPSDERPQHDGFTGYAL